jgi:hypothetical protein
LASSKIIFGREFTLAHMCSAAACALTPLGANVKLACWGTASMNACRTLLLLSINIRAAVNDSDGVECEELDGNIARLCNSLGTADAMEVYSSKTRLVKALLRHSRFFFKSAEKCTALTNVD